jgi:organic radical activating enzyme
MNGYVSEIFSSFQGEGLFAGRRHVFLRLAGCNLRCGYCDTPDSLERTPTCTIHDCDGGERNLANPLRPDRLSSLLAPFLSAPGVHALAVTGGEPLLQAGFLAEVLSETRPAVPVLLETNGTYPDRLRTVLSFVDIVSMDVKLPSNSGEPASWREHREFLAASRDKILYVKVPVDESTLEPEIEEAALLVREEAPGVAFFLQPILSPTAQVCISSARLERFYDLASRHLADVRVLPQAHRFLGIR